MKPLACRNIESQLDEHVRHELDGRRAARVTAHLAACSACASQAADALRAYQALDEVRGEAILDGIDESRFRLLRARVLSEVAREPRSASFFGLRLTGLRLAWSGAAAALVVASALALLSGPGPARIAGTAGGAGVVATASSDEQAVEVVTFATKGGVSLHWTGGATTYVVLKSSRPSLERAERTVVCGTEWTDRDPALGATFYRVIAAHEPCRT